MEFILIAIGIVIVLILLIFALVLGGIGAVSRGPRPHEGDKGTG